jgi:hypothetical protein
MAGIRLTTSSRTRTATGDVRSATSPAFVLVPLVASIVTVC